MTIDIDIKTNIEDIIELFDFFDGPMFTKASHVAIAKTLRTSRKEALKIIHKTIALNPKAKKRRDFKNDLTSIDVKKRASAFNTEGTLTFSGQSMPLLWFISGNIDKIKQKGIKIKKRRKLKAQVFRGKKFIVKKAFIQKAKSKQVFKAGKKGFKKQGVPSLAHFIEHRRMIKKIQLLMLTEYQKQMINQVSFRMEKAISKTNKAKLKLPR